MFSDKIEELKKDYPILGAEEFKECKNPEDYLEKLNNEFEKLNKESSQKRNVQPHCIARLIGKFFKRAK